MEIPHLRARGYEEEGSNQGKPSKGFVVIIVGFLCLVIALGT